MSTPPDSPLSNPSSTSSQPPAPQAPLLEENTLVHKWSDAIAPLKRYFRTRRLVTAGDPVFDYPPERLKSEDLMGPWTFNLTESALAALPTVMLVKVLSFFQPHVPTVPQGLSAIDKATAELLPGVLSTFQPFVAPVVPMLLAALCARGSLHAQDATVARRQRARDAYLYFDGSRGLIPQFTLSFVYTLRLAHGTRDVDARTRLGLCGTWAVFLDSHPIHHWFPRAALSVCFKRLLYPGGPLLDSEA